MKEIAAVNDDLTNDFLDAMHWHDAAVTATTLAMNQGRSKTAIERARSDLRQSCRNIFKLVFGRKPTKNELESMQVE